MDTKALIEELEHSKNYAIKQMEEFPKGSEAYWFNKGVINQVEITLHSIFTLSLLEQNEREDLPEHDPEQKHWEDLSTHYERFSGD